MEMALIHNSLLLLLFLVSCNADYSKKEKLQTENIIKQKTEKITFQYNKLHQKSTLNYQKVDTNILFKNKIQLLKNEDYDTEFHDIEITPNIIFHQNGIIHWKNNDKKPFSDMIRAYFLLNHKQIFLDDIFFSKDSTKNWWKKGHYPYIYPLKSVYNLQLKEKKFVIVYINTYLSNSTDFAMNIFLFDITSEIPHLVLVDRQESINMDCFGDWNNDGNLDYFHKKYRMQETKKLYVKTFKNDIWVTDSTKYIYLEGNFHQQIINIDKSRWYFDLK